MDIQFHGKMLKNKLIIFSPLLISGFFFRFFFFVVMLKSGVAKAVPAVAVPTPLAALHSLYSDCGVTALQCLNKVTFILTWECVEFWQKVIDILAQQQC